MNTPLGVHPATGAQKAINLRILEISSSTVEWRPKLESLREVWHQNSKDLSSINIATLMHRYAKALPPHQSTPVDHEPFLQAMDLLILRNAKLFDGQGHVCVACAYAKLKRAPADTLNSLAAASFKVGNVYNVQSLSALVWAHATLQSAAPDFDSKAFQIASEKVHEFRVEPYSCSNLVWAFACRSQKFAQRFVTLLGPSIASIEFNPISLLQLHHAGIAARLSYPRQLTEKIKVVLPRFEGVRSPPNAFEDEFSQVLKELSRSFLSQVPIAGYRADFVINDVSPKLVVELDGSAYHRLKGSGQGELVGSDILRNRVFAALGYQVIQVSDQEWYRIVDKPAWLNTKLPVPSTL